MTETKRETIRGERWTGEYPRESRLRNRVRKRNSRIRCQRMLRARWNPAKSAARLEGQTLLLNRRRNAGLLFALAEQRSA